jgi:hypothetical protein
LLPPSSNAEGSAVVIASRGAEGGAVEIECSLPATAAAYAHACARGVALPRPVVVACPAFYFGRHVMMRRTLFAISLTLAACTGSRGPDGAPGADGTNGTNGSNGSNGNDVILSTRAKHGLDIAPVQLDLTGLTPDQIEQVGQGSYLVNAAIDCSGCHNSPTGGYLAGGVQFPFGPGAGNFVYTRNLTPDPTTGLHHTEAQFIETLQTGRDFHADQNGGNGQLIVMPWPNFRWLHVADMKAIYAYLKAIPPVVNAVPADSKGPAAVLTPIPLPNQFAVGEQFRLVTPETDYMGNPIPDPDGVVRGIEINPLRDPPLFASLDGETQARFGRGSYLVDAGPCSDCHTNPPYDPINFQINTSQYLAGGGLFVTPPGLGPVFHTTRSMSANLLGQTNGFFVDATEPVFQAILETGQHVDDPVQTPLAWPMPWDHFRNLETEDLVSIFTYLHVLQAEEPRTMGNDKPTQPAAIYCDAMNACPGGYSCHMDTAVGNECVGNVCGSDQDCGACQTCDNTKHCVAPTPMSTCLASGL